MKRYFPLLMLLLLMVTAIADKPMIHKPKPHDFEVLIVSSDLNEVTVRRLSSIPPPATAWWLRWRVVGAINWNRPIYCWDSEWWITGFTPIATQTFEGEIAWGDASGPMSEWSHPQRVTGL